jgi:poly(3-hydroxybutyrate) depolymerase
MAVQFQVAYSGIVRGAGVVAGGPYDCAAGTLRRAIANCMEPAGDKQPPSADETLANLNRLAAGGKIDPIADLRGDRVWLFAGGQDKTVAPAVMDALAAFYRKVLPEEAIRYVKLPDAGHAMPSVTATGANACSTSSPPYINRCGDFDAAGQLLAQVAGPLQPPADPLAGDVVPFDQSAYIDGAPIDASLGPEGYVFVPKACSGGGCRVHVAFHGCRQDAGEIGRRFVDGAGYNRWAATNRIVVLYPQTAARSGFAFGSFRWVFNPKGCWDWWGYTGPDYATRDGVQMRAVRAMIERLAAPPAPSASGRKMP